MKMQSERDKIYTEALNFMRWWFIIRKHVGNQDVWISNTI